jgi:hypothetical protein
MRFFRIQIGASRETPLTPKVENQLTDIRSSTKAALRIDALPNPGPLARETEREIAALLAAGGTSAFERLHAPTQLAMAHLTEKIVALMGGVETIEQVPGLFDHVPVGNTTQQVLGSIGLDSGPIWMVNRHLLAERIAQALLADHSDVSTLFSTTASKSAATARQEQPLPLSNAISNALDHLSPFVGAARPYLSQVERRLQRAGTQHGLSPNTVSSPRSLLAALQGALSFIDATHVNAAANARALNIQQTIGLSLLALVSKERGLSVPDVLEWAMEPEYSKSLEKAGTVFNTTLPVNVDEPPALSRLDEVLGIPQNLRGDANRRKIVKEAFANAGVMASEPAEKATLSVLTRAVKEKQNLLDVADALMQWLGVRHQNDPALGGVQQFRLRAIQLGQEQASIVWLMNHREYQSKMCQGDFWTLRAALAKNEFRGTVLRSNAEDVRQVRQPEWGQDATVGHARMNAFAVEQTMLRNELRALVDAQMIRVAQAVGDALGLAKESRPG